MRVLIPDYFAYELCAALAKPAERLVDVVHGELDAEAAYSVHWGVPLIRDDGQPEEAGETRDSLPT